MIVTRGIGQSGGAIVAWGFGLSAVIVVADGPGCLHLFAIKPNTVTLYVMPSSCD